MIDSFYEQKDVLRYVDTQAMFLLKGCAYLSTHTHANYTIHFSTWRIMMIIPLSTWIVFTGINHLQRGYPSPNRRLVPAAGNQYGLTALAESCAERLSSMLSAQNVVQVLQVLGRNEGAATRKLIFRRMP